MGEEETASINIQTHIISVASPSFIGIDVVFVLEPDIFSRSQAPRYTLARIQLAMSPSAVDDAPKARGAAISVKPNIGVFTNPKHDLWISEAEPSADAVKSGADLKPGEVTIAVRSTGICG